MKIVINARYGGFGVSKEFMDYYNIEYRQILSNTYYPTNEIKRTDKRLIEFIEKYGSEKTSSRCAKLIIKEIPKGTLYRITEYDGYEDIETMNTIDWEIAE